MSSGFSLFGPVHLAIMASVPGVAFGLARAARGHPARSRLISSLLGISLGANELIWYAWRLKMDGFRFPEALPLELCDLTLWLTVTSTLLYGAQWQKTVSGLTLRPAIFEFAWLAGFGGALMAVLTPDLWAAPLSYLTIYFLLAHGGVMVALLYLVWSRLARPRPGCVWRTFGLINVYAALIGFFNAIFHTNYMYLCQKPGNASLLDFFGPWPLYLLGGEATALVMFWLLWAPFRRASGPT